MGLHSGVIQCKSWKNSLNFHLLNRKISNKSHVTGVTVKEGSQDQETCLFVTPIPWSRKGQPIPVFLPRNSQGQRSMGGYSPWACKELDTTERLSTHIITHILTHIPTHSLLISPCDNLGSMDMV